MKTGRSDEEYLALNIEKWILIQNSPRFEPWAVFVRHWSKAFLLFSITLICSLVATGPANNKASKLEFVLVLVSFCSSTLSKACWSDGNVLII